jgi:hypothetical protein
VGNGEATARVLYWPGSRLRSRELRDLVRVGITQALDVDAARQAAFDGCLDEFWSKKRE